VGQKVKKGEPLFSVYSPEVVGSQQELISAAKRAAAGPDPGAEAMLSATRGRLRHWDVPEETIAAIEKSGEIRRVITVNAPRDGTVLTRAAVPGMMVEPKMALYTIADLSRVWVIADVYEFEAPAVHVGQTAWFAPVGSKAREIEATVAFVAPTVDPKTRTVKVRLDVPNDAGELRPGAYGMVRLDIAVPEGIVVSSDAVIDTGDRTIVFIDRGNGLFEPRGVKLGARVGDRVHVAEGLKEGESVVTRAQFLLDSESRIRGGPTGPGHSGH
jgi:Cu(I)/Ag(I) efflux system membrane fusion protein